MQLLHERPLNAAAIQRSIEEQGKGGLVEAIVKAYMRFYLPGWRCALDESISRHLGK